MTRADRIAYGHTLPQLLYNHHPRDGVERLARRGDISRGTAARYLALWSWAVPRFGFAAGDRQDAFYKARGPEAFRRRMAAVKALHDRIAARGEADNRAAAAMREALAGLYAAQAGSSRRAAA